MGTEFFWFYDVVIVAIIVGIVIKCGKRGFLSSVASLLALVVAFAAALPLSGVISDAIYDGFVKGQLEKSIEESLDGVLDETVVSDISKIDTSKIVINQKPITEISLTPDASGKVKADLMVVDFSQTGIEDVDLTMFGLGKDTDFSQINLGTLVISKQQLEDYGLPKIVLAATLSAKLSEGSAFAPVCKVAEYISQTLPQMMSGYGASVESGDKSVIRDLMLSVINTDSGTISDSILSTIVRPVITVPVRALVFIALFVLLLVLLRFVSKLLRVVNKIPLVGTVNSILGAVLGVAEAAVVIFIVCIGVQVLVNMTGNSLIAINTEVIDSTLLFKHIYYFDFLDFLA